MSLSLFTEKYINKVEVLAQQKETLLPVSEEVSTILLTGATGFLGAYLIEEIQKQYPSAYTICLVRAEDNAAALERLLANIERYNLKVDQSKVEAIAGRLDDEHLSLSQEQYERLAREVDMIFHSAAKLNFVFPIAQLEKANIYGTYEMIALASTYKKKQLVYISSCGTRLIASYDGREDKGMYNGYVQSKFVSAKIVAYAAKQIEIPTAVLPLGYLCSADNRQFTYKDSVESLISLMFKMKAAPIVDAYVDFTAVDFAAKEIVYHSINNRQPYSYRHIHNPHKIKWGVLNDKMKEVCPEMEILPLDAFLQRLHKLLMLDFPKTNAVYALKAITDEFANQMNIMFDLPITEKDYHFTCPDAVNSSYLHNLLHFIYEEYDVIRNILMSRKLEM